VTEPLPDRVWRRFALTFLGLFGGGVGLLYVALLVIDPYDTGRFPTFMKTGVVDEGQRTSNASHGRDPRFTAAVIGNSRGQMLDPAKLSALTGMDFVQLTTPASGPVEQMTMLRYFMQYHRRIDAIILTIDERWCGHDQSLPIILPFPFWLYRGNLDYLGHFFSARALTFAAGPLQHVGPPVVAPLETPFAGFELLDPVLAGLPATTHAVFLMSPVHQEFLDHELDPQIIADLPRCKAEVAERAAARPNTAFLDYFHESAISHDAENFMDTQHFRLNIARLLEVRIAEVLNGDVKSALGSTDNQ
jgi:hypothetical protein